MVKAAVAERSMFWVLLLVNVNNLATTLVFEAIEIHTVPTEFSKSAYLVFNEYHEGERKFMKLHVYTAKKWQGVIRESDEMKPEWFPIKQLPLQNMWPADSIWLPEVLEGNKIRGEFVLDENTSVIESSIQKVESL